EKARAPGIRDALIKGFMEATPPLRHEQIVARNREVTARR
ncbi:3-hydroxyisobutyrate dehydrogenase, partial [Mesorhizobium sp. M7A.F.Ca.US.001.01.1.1]